MSELMKDSDVVSGFLKMLMCAYGGDIDAEFKLRLLVIC